MIRVEVLRHGLKSKEQWKTDDMKQNKEPTTKNRILRKVPLSKAGSNDHSGLGKARGGVVETGQLDRICFPLRVACSLFPHLCVFVCLCVCAPGKYVRPLFP